jgi:ADP-ribosylglycohydrolase
MQLRQEGADVSDVEARLDGLGEGQAEAVLEELAGRRPITEDEPEQLEAILAAGAPSDESLSAPGDLEDRLLGAWFGRCAGSMLGKPVEGRPKAELAGYATAGRIGRHQQDDDVDYTILALDLLEKRGLAFTTEDVADSWLSSLAYLNVFTAERVAYKNLVDGLPASVAGSYRNPYREWIGAAIRTDLYGYVNPARPGAAAELAYRDAAISHRKNGIYAAMFVAAAVAAAMGGGSPIAHGLSVVPARSRLAMAIRELIAWHVDLPAWEDCWQRIDAAHGHHDWVHAIPNLLNVVLGLLYGEGDFGRSIAITVSAGWDTDSNGATVGSIMGAALGAKRLPREWIEPLGDEVRSWVPGYDRMKIQELVERTARL